tara:strand:+ start:453 stop:635 length:183 start_codon:yes stop_codon:yes gene_type:complete
MNQDSVLNTITLVGSGSGFILWMTEITPVLAFLASFAAATSGFIKLYRTMKNVENEDTSI